MALKHNISSSIDLDEELFDIWFWWRFSVKRGPEPTGTVRRDFLREIMWRARALSEALEKSDNDLWKLIDDIPKRRVIEVAALAEMLQDLELASAAAMLKVSKTKAGRRTDTSTIRLLSRLWDTYQLGFGPNAPRISKAEVYGGKFFEFANDVLMLFGLRKSNASLGRAIEKALGSADSRRSRKLSP